MKVSILFLIILPLGLWATSDFGMKIMVGGRYDTVRMCVASPANSKGGMIADIMLLSRLTIKDNLKLSVELPVMRPILFAAAFKMLQFEPQIIMEMSHQLRDNLSFVSGPGLGLSLHYGPSYQSTNDERGDSFFSVGPIICGSVGLAKIQRSGKERRLAVRAFYIPLFTSSNTFDNGTVVGAVLEGSFTF